MRNMCLYADRTKHFVGLSHSRIDSLLRAILKPHRKTLWRHCRIIFTCLPKAHYRRGIYSGLAEPNKPHTKTYI